MSFRSGKLTILSMLISSILLTSPVYASEPTTNPVSTIAPVVSTSFPETLQALIDAPGKKDFITIPMPTKYYENEYKKHLDGEWSQRKVAIQDTFKDHTITEKDGITLVTLNTNISEAFIRTSDLNNEFYYSYAIANGYILNTNISTYFSQDDEGVSDKMDYLSDSFSQYLINKGFQEETTMMNFIPRKIKKNKEFRLGDHVVLIQRENDFFSRRFEVVIQNKLIEDNLDAIMKDIKVNNLKNEYKTLDKILK